MQDHALRVDSVKELHRQEQVVLARLHALPNGEQRFLAHPLRALADAGVELGPEVHAALVRRYPQLAILPETAYAALKATPVRQAGAFRLHGLFNWSEL
jgi:hypothetical protein